MNKNSNLHKAKEKKNDEFYTQLSDIEEELRHYKHYFKDKVVLCNCDDPYESNFFKYFALNFNRLGLKKLIATGYATSPVAGKELQLFDDEKDTPKNQSYVVYINGVTDLNGDGRIDLEDVKILLKEKRNYRRKLKGNIALDEKGMPIQITANKPCFDEEGNPILDKKGNQKTESVKQNLYYEAGDFRSDESITLLKQADIVVTNPPFSLFREYVHQLVEYGKKFVIMGNKNAITYKEFFPLLKANKVWVGASSLNGGRWMILPRGMEIEKKDKTKVNSHGETILNVAGVCWFTNLDIRKRHETLDLYKAFNPEEYPKYDNYDAINVDKTSDIPCDYDGVMGVPITFLDKYNPEQFEIVGWSRHNEYNMDGGYWHQGTNNDALINGKSLYRRILIRKRKSVVLE